MDHEMRVRGLWPYLSFYADRPISLPIQWQDWIVDAPGGDDGDDGDGMDGSDDKGDGHEEEENDDGDDDLSLSTVVDKSECDIIYRQFGEQQQQQQLERPDINALLCMHLKRLLSGTQ